MIPKGSHIRISVQWVPDGDMTKAQDMGRAYIVNTGGDAYIADYSIKIMKYAGTLSRKLTWKTGAIFDVPRSTLGPWDVLFRLLHEVIGVRNRGACTGTGQKSARYNARKRKERNGQQAEGARGASGELCRSGDGDGHQGGAVQEDAGADRSGRDGNGPDPRGDD